MADLAKYLQLKYKDSAIGFYTPPTDMYESEVKELDLGVVELESDPFFDKNSAGMQVSQFITDSLDSRNLDEIKQRNIQFIRNLINQYQKEVQNLIKDKIQKELEIKKKEELIIQKKKEFKELRANWRVLCKEIINFCLEEKLLGLMSNQVYKIIPRHVKKKIREMVFMVLDKVSDDYKGFLLLDSRQLLKTYFPEEFGEMQEFLDGERERIERVKIEEKRRIQAILLYIKDFLKSELRVISKFHITDKFLKLTRDEIIRFLCEGFEESLINDGITEGKEYKEHFRQILSSEIKHFIKKLNNKIKELQKSQAKTSLREYIMDHKVLLVAVLLLSVFLTGYFVWIFSLPYLIRFSFETANLWIYPVIGTLVGIDIILFILLFNRN